VITEATSTAADLLGAAAAVVVGSLACSEPLTAGDPTREAGILEGDGQAVLVQFTGSSTGDFALIVDGELTTALRDSPYGALELAAALAPTIESVGGAIGPVVLGPIQQLDVRLAVHRVLAHADAALVPLHGASEVRAAVALGLDAAAMPAATGTAPSADRLDLLRGVEMAATAELGRARMTVNDLLSLHTGAVIELDRAAGAPADLLVNGRLIARGEVVVVDENYGLRITQVVADDSGR
jgi:flagellar motor switch protein FliN